MVGVYAPGRALERLGFERVGGLEIGVVHDAAPPVGIRHYRAPYLADGRGVGTPYPRSDEHVAGLKVQVESRPVNLSPHLVPEMYARVGLVRALVLGEADVAVDAEYGAAGQPGICDHVRAYLTQDFAEVHHEVDQRVPDVALVPRLVVLEPLAVLLSASSAKELEQGRSEVGRRGHSVYSMFDCR